MAKQPNAYKKFVATAATATLVATALAPVASAAPVDSYKDVSKDYKDAVNYLLENGIAQGTSDTTFGTSNNISRGDAAVMIANALKLDTANAKDQGFQDVNSRVEGAVNAIVEAGIASGRTTAKFDPAAYITRQEMAKMLANAYKLTATEKAGFKDVNKNWIDYVSALKENGITLGKSETIFAPEQNLTRGEFALFVFRAENPDPELAIVEAVTVVNETTTTATLKTANKELTAKDFTVLVNGKEVTPTKVESDAKGEVYTITHASLKDTSGTVSVNGKQAAFNFVVVEPKVESVKAINATQVEVKFNNEVDAATVFAAGTSGTLKTGVFAFSNLDPNSPLTNNVAGNSATGELSKDGKTLTITADTGKVFEGRYDVKIDGLKDVDGKKVEVFEKKVLDLGKDTTAPTITGTERVSANKVKIKFSEPVQAHTPTYTYADGTTESNVTTTVSAGATEVLVDLSNAGVPVNKEITVTFNGLKDMAGNIVTPQPSTVKITKEQVDGVAPAISSVTQTGAKTFNIKFSKNVEDITFTADGTEVDVSGTPAVTAIDKVSANEYKVTVDANLDGATTVTVKAGKAVDLAGQTSATDLSKVVTFSQDVVAPKVTASKLVVDKNNAEVLELTFDKDVTAGVVTLAGKQVKDYVTTTGINETPTAVYADGKGTNKKVLHVPLSAAALKVEGAAYDLTVSSTAVTSVSGNKAMDSMKVQFTRGKDGVAPSDVKTALKAVTPIAQDASINNKVTVEFTDNVDGATGTNVANYKIDGAVVESARIVAGSPKIVELTLKADSNTFTGVRNVTVENVKAAGSSVAMDKYTGTVTLKENVAPKVEKAVLTTTTEVTLTFSEAVSLGASSTDDFALVIGGKTVATTVTAPTSAASSVKTVALTLGTAVTAEDIAKGLELKVLPTTLDVKDAAGNNLFTSGNIKITNN
ncbi:S-layer homology domain-containing protein [Sporosarcina gallistercoris]|uniref:S-layer homology domain-containing protein n=1 Tax=Sporosarcina gallistercoris TaxID=2762245 RepID=A0ABR8PLS5_9BACL|nr:S-layer homology domain-containing protein [Sporosarcina gallistercoris]MBD7909118.1 S-layer homology domain-containing protein [Sporosarcina gallistercoris]